MATRPGWRMAATHASPPTDLLRLSADRPSGHTASTHRAQLAVHSPPPPPRGIRPGLANAPLPHRMQGRMRGMNEAWE